MVSRKHKQLLLLDICIHRSGSGSSYISLDPELLTSLWIRISAYISLDPDLNTSLWIRISAYISLDPELNTSLWVRICIHLSGSGSVYISLDPELYDISNPFSSLLKYFLRELASSALSVFSYNCPLPPITALSLP